MTQTTVSTELLDVVREAVDTILRAPVDVRR